MASGQDIFAGIEHLIFVHTSSTVLALSVEARPIGVFDDASSGRNDSEAIHRIEAGQDKDMPEILSRDICFRCLNLQDEAEFLVDSREFMSSLIGEASLEGDDATSSSSAQSWSGEAKSCEAISSRSRSDSTDGATGRGPGDANGSRKCSDIEYESTTAGTSRQQSWNSQESSENLHNSVDSHANGTCRPCRFFQLKEKGCQLGDSCKFCHLCTFQEAKAERLRAKYEHRRKARREARAAKQPKQPENSVCGSSNLDLPAFPTAWF